MNRIVLYVLPLLLLVGCDRSNDPSASVSDASDAAAHAELVEAFLKAWNADAEMHIDTPKGRHEVWIEIFELLGRMGKIEISNSADPNLDPSVLMDELGLGSSSASGCGIARAGHLWQLCHFAHHVDGLPPAMRLFGDTKPFSVAALPATTDIAVELRLNGSSIPGIMRRYAAHTGNTDDVEVWLKKKLPVGLPWEEVFSLADMDVLLSMEFEKADEMMISKRNMESLLRVRTDPALVAACIPWLTHTYGEAKDTRGIKWWPTHSSIWPEFEILLLDGDDTFIMATSLEHWEAVNRPLELLGEHPTYLEATRGFPEFGSMQAYVSPMISSGVREWMESGIRQIAELRGFEDVDVNLAPQQPWAVCVARRETGVLTLVSMPFHPESRDTRAMTAMSGPGAVLIVLREWRKGSERAHCIMNIRNVQQVIRGHEGMHNMRTGDEIDWNYLFGPDGFMKKPVCPSGGIYEFSKTIQPIGVLGCKCSHSDSLRHEPDDFSNW